MDNLDSRLRGNDVGMDNLDSRLRGNDVGVDNLDSRHGTDGDDKGCWSPPVPTCGERRAAQDLVGGERKFRHEHLFDQRALQQPIDP